MSPDQANHETALTAEALALNLNDGSRPPFALRDLHLQLEAGEMVVLRGVSGCGKSSLLQALARLLPLESGRLRLAGMAAEQMPPPVWRARVSLVHAEPLLVEGSVEDNLLLPWNFRALRHRPPPGAEEQRAALAALGLGEFALEANVRGLSSGQASRVALARNLLLRPSFLLLDEPTANLDADSAQRVWRALEAQRRETGCGILCVAHQRPGMAPDRALRLRGGRLGRG